MLCGRLVLMFQRNIPPPSSEYKIQMVVGFSKTLLATYQTTWCSNPQDYSMKAVI